MIRAGLKWVFLITGTTIGAGYASGREIWQFFGSGSELAILIFMILFILSVNIILKISYEAQTSDYLPVLRKIVGRKLTKVYDYLILVYLFCVTLVMIAGSGASFQGYGFPLWWGTGLIYLGLILIFQKGINELLAVNQVLMPLLIISLFVVLAIFMYDEQISFAIDWKRQDNWTAAFPFTALNILPLIAVLGAIGSKIRTKGEIYIASTTSGLLLGVISFIYNKSLVHLSLQMIIDDIPLFAIINNYGGKVMLLMTVMLWLAIYTTAAATLLGMVTRIKNNINLSMGKLVIIILLSMLPLTKIGFTQLVAVIYPIYGVLNLYVLVKIIFYPIGNK